MCTQRGVIFLIRSLLSLFFRIARVSENCYILPCILPNSSHWNPIPLSVLEEGCMIQVIFIQLACYTTVYFIQQSSRESNGQPGRCIPSVSDAYRSEKDTHTHAPCISFSLSLSLSLCSASALMKITSYVVVIHNVLLHTVCQKY